MFFTKKLGLRDNNKWTCRKMNSYIGLVLLSICVMVFHGCEDLGPEMEHDNIYDQANPEGYERLYPGCDSTFILFGNTTIDMVWIPSGIFIMGAQEGESNAFDDLTPRHEVTIRQGFWVGKYEVTQKQWEAVIGDWNFHFDGHPNRPAEAISYYDIVNNFLPEINAMEEENPWRLPTEAEWEYACRAGIDDQWFWWGSSYSYLDEYAWYKDNSNTGNGNETHDVGQKIPNPWGLCDMHGNVWEWCSDWYDENYYDSSPDVDPQGPSSGEYRVLRGGSWYRDAGDCRAAYRSYSQPSSRYQNYGSGHFDYFGFRVVRYAQ